MKFLPPESVLPNVQQGVRLPVFVLALLCAVQPVCHATVFQNTAAITLNDANTNPHATPYPSTISVSGLSGTINHVSVTLKNITYQYSSDIDVLLVSPTGLKFVVFANVGNDSTGTSANNVTVTLDDSSATTYAQGTSLGNANGSVTFKPVFTTMGNPGEGDTYTAPAPSGPYAAPAPKGSATFASVFNGANPNGTWSLYVVIDTTGDGTGSFAGGWSIDLTTASAAATTTTLASSLNPSFTAAPSNAVPLTASVSSSSTVNEGTVTFKDGGVALPGSSTVSVVNGQAKFTNSFSAEGSHSLTTTYSGTANFGASSSASVTQQVDNHTLANGSTFCNPGAIALHDANTNPDGTPYPSRIFVSGLSGTIGHMAVTLSNVTYNYSSDLDVLLVGPGGQKFIVLSDVGTDTGTVPSVTGANNVTLILDDASGSVLASNVSLAHPNGSVTTRPVAFTTDPDAFGAPAPAGPYPAAAPQGIDTLATVFNGASANGTWSLYVTIDSSGDGTGSVAGGWCLNFTTVGATATTTTLASDNNPSFTTAPSNTVTLTATVAASPTVNEGTVTFKESGVALPGGSTVNVTNGHASFTTSFASEGSHALTAYYNGSTNFNISNGSVTQRVDGHTTITGNSFCNTNNLVLNDGNTSAAATPYPSHIFVSGLSSTISKLTITFKGVTYPYSQDIDALLVGPGGQKFILVSDVGPATGTHDISNVTLTLDDAAPSMLASNVVWGTPGASVVSKPVNYLNASGLDTWGAPAPAGPYSNPGPEGGGTATLGSIFNGTNPNGVWSLYVTIDTTGDGTGNFAGGWCLTICTPPVITNAPAVCGNSTGNQAGGPAGAASYAWTIANGAITSATNTQNITYAAGASGSVTLGLTTTFAGGCNNTNSVTVTVKDTELPVPNCPGNMTLTATGNCPAVVNFSVSATDNCGGVTVNANPPSGSPFAVGTNTVRITAVDASGNTNTCSFLVTVLAGAAPQLSVARLGTNVLLSWSTSYPCYSLQFAPRLLPPSSNVWTTYAGPRGTNGGNFVVTNSASVSNRFYRLSY